MNRVLPERRRKSHFFLSSLEEGQEGQPLNANTVVRMRALKVSAHAVSQMAQSSFMTQISEFSSAGGRGLVFILVLSVSQQRYQNKKWHKILLVCQNKENKGFKYTRAFISIPKLMTLTEAPRPLLDPLLNLVSFLVNYVLCHRHFNFVLKF